MTSQLLRKLQTTLWSTPRRTDSASAMKTLLRGISLAGMVAFMSAPEVAADNSRATSKGAGSVVQRPEIASAMSADEGVRHSSTTSATVVRPATRTRVTPAGGTPPEPLFVEQQGVIRAGAEMPPAPATTNAPAISAEARQQIAPPVDRRFSRTQHADEGFSARMDYVLSGGVVSSSAESVGEWWEERSGQMMNRVQPGRRQPQQPPMQRLANAREQMINNITLPEQPLPEVDFYDAAPIAVSSSSGVTQTAGQEDVTAIADSAPASRLKTDIRTIQPTLSYAMKGIVPDQLPVDFNDRVNTEEYQPRQASPTVYQWAPTNFYHYPLYFEDPSLERYGHTYHPVVQPFASTGRFATQLVGLPYQMALHPIHSKQYALGYYRPGEYAPKKHYQIPFNEEATVVEVATVVGLFLIIP
jgi:hypothetical protein